VQDNQRDIFEEFDSISVNFDRESEFKQTNLSAAQRGQ